MCVRVVPELCDQRMPFERRLHDPSLDAAAASVHEPQSAQAGFVRGAYVLLDHRRDVPRRERVKVEFRFDGNGVGWGIGQLKN